MDDWLLHKDILEKLPNYYRSSGKSLLTLFGRVESTIERDFYILLALKKEFSTSCLKKDEFNTEIQKSDMSLTRRAATQEETSQQEYTIGFCVFPMSKIINLDSAERTLKKTSRESQIVLKFYVPSSALKLPF